MNVKGFEITQEGFIFIKGINPRDRKEQFYYNDKGELFNTRGEKIGKIKYIKTRQVLNITTTFVQEIKIVKRKKITSKKR